MSRPARRSSGHTLAGIFAVPALLAIVSLVGLISALVGDGPLDAVSWATLALPVAICLWYGSLRRSG